MQQKFLDKYYPPAKAAQVRRELSSIRQGSLESMYEYLERFNALEQNCYNLGLPEPVVIEYLLAGLLPLGRMLLDAAAGGSVMNLTPGQVRKLIAETAESARFREESERRDNTGRVRNVAQVDASNAQLAAEVMELKDLVKQQFFGQVSQVRTKACEFSGALEHPTDACPSLQFQEDPAGVNAMGHQNFGNGPQNQRKFGLAANGFSWRNEGFNQGNQSNQYQNQHQNPSKSLEDIVRDLAISVQQTQLQLQQNQLKTDGAIAEMSKQISHLAASVSELKNDPGRLPSQVVQNPKGNVNALAIGAEDHEASAQESVEEQEEEHLSETCAGESHSARSSDLGRDPRGDGIPNARRDDQHTDSSCSHPSCRDCLQEMVHADPIQEEEPERVKTSQTRDPGAFTVTCGIGNTLVHNCLIDLGASLNVMPYELYCLLNLGPLKPPKLRIELGNRSSVKPVGLLENLTLHVGEVVVFADFYVLQMEDNQTKESPTLILGRPFLFTTKAQIDVAEGTMKFTYGGKVAEFKVYEEDAHRPRAEKPPNITGKMSMCSDKLTDGALCSVQEVEKKKRRQPHPPGKRKRYEKKKCGVVARKTWMPSGGEWKAKPPNDRQRPASELTGHAGKKSKVTIRKFDLNQPWDPNL